MKYLVFCVSCILFYLSPSSPLANPSASRSFTDDPFVDENKFVETGKYIHILYIYILYIYYTYIIRILYIYYTNIYMLFPVTFHLKRGIPDSQQYGKNVTSSALSLHNTLGS